MPRGEFLLEVRAEEIPARMLRPAADELRQSLAAELERLSLSGRGIETTFTPRRLVLVARGLPAREPDRSERQVGPPKSAAFDAEGVPTAAALGFARRCGVEVEALQVVETDKGEYLAVDSDVEGRPTGEVLAGIVPGIVESLSWPKTMRWGTDTGPWVRPVHGILALFEEAVVAFELFGVASDGSTVGHPIHSPKAFEVKGWADYRRKLRRRKVEIDYEARRNHLASAMNELAREAGGTVVEDLELLDKLASICEVPGVVMGEFSPEFSSLPREVLIASLRDHQSAFTVESGDELLPVFLTVMDRADDPAGRVRAGNEWVVDARLADARFFYDEDRKRTLEQGADRLESLTFHVRLGNYADKTRRVKRLASFLCDALDWKNEKAAAEQAAGLLKADLPCEMVKEFTSLQGVIGGLYAREDGLPDEVWQAVYDQYLPAGASDAIPRSKAGLVCAIADRIDTLVGIFGLGEKPTGSRDPFGLRRAAQGILRIVLEAELSLDLDLVAAQAALLYGDRLSMPADEVPAVLRPFLEDRIRHLLGLEGYAYDEIEAALAVGFADLPDLRARVRALHSMRRDAGFLAVVQAAKRISNILRDAPEREFSKELLREPAEKALWESSRTLRLDVEQEAARGDYEACFHKIAAFAEVLETFFAEVLVMDENRELRSNRLALLQSIQRTLSKTARLSEVVVDRTEGRKGHGS